MSTIESNAVVFVGNITETPTLRTTNGGGHKVTSFGLAAKSLRWDSEKKSFEDAGKPLFVRCNVWRVMAQNTVDSLTKGARVIVWGTLESRPYTVGDEERPSLELDVREIGPSLRWATAKPVKRSSGDRGQA